MNLLLIEAFVAVVRLGSLQKAGESLGVSSATISRRITELEGELRTRLVERTTRSLRVTDLGRAFFDRCADGLEAIDEARAMVSSRQTRIAGTARISTAPNLGPLLLGAIAETRRLHPDVHVQLVETERRLDLHRDDFDLFVRVGGVAHEGVVARKLGVYPHVLVASKEYLARAGSPARPDDLESHAIVAFGGQRRFSGWEVISSKRGDSVRIAVQPGLLTNDYRTLTEAVRSGMGIGDLPTILSAGDSSLTRVLPGWSLGTVPLHLIYAADRLLSAAVRAVIEGIVAKVPSAVTSSAPSIVG